MTKKLSAVIASSLTLASCSSSQEPVIDTHVGPEQLTVSVIKEYPFDRESFTQGLEVDANGDLLVGTGLEGDSQVYRRTLDGEVLDSEELDERYFGEGITVHGEILWQLTWKDGIAVKRGAQSLQSVDTVSYGGEGWGICSDGENLITSDGSDRLTIRNPETFEMKDSLTVTMNGEPVRYLNELECVGDDVYANVFLTDEIVKIDNDGKVTAVVDASSLEPDTFTDPDNVLNGIAHIPGTDRFLVTGKRWGNLYEVEFVEK